MELPQPSINTLAPKRKLWTNQEDDAIRQIVQNCQFEKWSQVSKTLLQQYGIFYRSGKQCRERWLNHLSPNINKQPWNPEEQSLLFSLHKQMGNIWARIADYLPGRSENSVKNQFYSMLKRQYRKFKGGNPTRKSLVKYDQILSSQILTALHKKINQKKAPRQPKFEKIVVLQDLETKQDCIEQRSENSTLHDEQELTEQINFPGFQ